MRRLSKKRTRQEDKWATQKENLAMSETIQLPTKHGFIDITGNIYSRLTVISYSGSSKRGALWLCKCDCGNETVQAGGDLRCGRLVSCGCWKREANSERSKTHGESGSALYVVWSGMKKRCNNIRCRNYRNYGERGIKVCDEWSASYESFRDWSIASGYAPGLEIDREDNDGNYEPSNCRWVTGKVNCRNNRRNRVLLAFGESKTLIEWVEDSRCVVLYDTVRHRLAAGWTTERALTVRAVPS